MDFSWFWENIAFWIFTALVGAMSAAIKRSERLRGWADPLMYALAAMALVGVLRVTWTGWRYLSTRPEPVEIENLQTSVRDWMLGLTWGVREVPIEDDCCFFAYEVTLPQGGKVGLSRPKELGGRFLLAHTNLNFDPYIAPLKKVPMYESARLIGDVRQELLRAKIDYEGLSNPPSSTVTVRKLIPITADTNEHQIASVVQELEYMRKSVSEIVITRLQYRPPVK